VVDTDAAVLALNEERVKLVHQLKQLGATESGDLTGDVDFGEGFADAAAATAERSEVLGIVENLHDLLVDVDAALEKVGSGTYGTCEDCGQEISPARMDFRPTSRYCVTCKSKRRTV
jgi:RNA polymerase-binding transcription factor DksA